MAIIIIGREFDQILYDYRNFIKIMLEGNAIGGGNFFWLLRNVCVRFQIFCILKNIGYLKMKTSSSVSSIFIYYVHSLLLYVTS